LNGSFTGGVESGGLSGTGFSAGDVITLTVTASAGGDMLGLSDLTNFASLIPPTGAAGTYTYAVPADTDANFIIGGARNNAGSIFSWSCTPAGGANGGGTDSDRLGSVQNQGSAVVANTSGVAISSAVDGAIGAALEAGMTPSEQDEILSGPLSWGEFIGLYLEYHIAAQDGEQTGRAEFVKQAHAIWYAKSNAGLIAVKVSGPLMVKWMTYSEYQQARAQAQTGAGSQFAPEQVSSVRQRADEAFAALGYAAVKAPSRGTLTPESQWIPWADIRGTGFEQSDAGALKGTQINATAGLTYRLSKNVVVGVFAGYEHFDYDFASLTGKLKGDGGTVGTYAGWQITPTLRWKGMVGWTGLGYDASAGTAAGTFDGSRWLFSTGLTGSYALAAFILEPSADVFAVWERQTQYTDTLGANHDARSFSSGRLSLGGRALAPGQGLWGATPYLGLYGDWRFASNDAEPSAAPYAGIGEGWSARVTGGFSVPVFATGTLALGGEYGGIGADYKLWTGNARLTLPF